MTCRMIRRESSGRWSCRHGRGDFRRSRVSFVRPRTVAFTGECPPIDVAFVRRIEIRGPEPATDNVVRVNFPHARLSPQAP